jgi:1-acyl-sn-glycerol-3-phosphate acyltransferase
VTHPRPPEREPTPVPRIPSAATSSVASLVGAVAGSVAGVSRMLGAASGDVIAVVDPRRLAGRRPAIDPLDLRDPEYIRRTLPALRAMSGIYFRAEVRGMENIPARGPVLLVGNHSGGTLIADTFVFAQAFYDHFGADRVFHQLAHDLVFKVPGVRALVAPYGTVPASPENVRRALARDAALLVYPGGDHETYRATWHSADIDFAHRTGFVRLALELGLPIVPVVAIGGQETALFLGQGESVARLLHLHRLLRIDVAPVQIAPPWGVTVLDFPGRVPLPAKITVEVLPAIDLAAELGADADADAGYDLITGRMQEALDELADARTFPLVG